MEDPTDEMLSYIVREAAEAARKSDEAATQKIFADIAEMKKKWFKGNRQRKKDS